MDTSWKPPRFLKRRESELALYRSFNRSTTLEQLHFVLSLPPTDRTQVHLTLLMTATKGVKFYTELREQYGEFVHLELCRHLTYQQSPSEAVVFEEGQEGSTFYSILAGSCAVIVLKRTAASTEKKPALLSILREGDSFGELALLYRKPRAAGVLCREDCFFAVLDRPSYLETLKLAKERHQVEKVALLKQHQVFGIWPEDAVKLLAQKLRMRVLRRKQVLFAAGQQTTHLFLIKAGSFRLTMEVSRLQSLNGRLLPIRYQDEMTTVGRGELLGVSTLASSQPWPITSVCISAEAEVLAVGQRDFQALAQNSYAALVLLERRREERAQRLQRTRKPQIRPASPLVKPPLQFFPSFSHDSAFHRGGSLPDLTCPVPERLEDIEAVFRPIHRI